MQSQKILLLGVTVMLVFLRKALSFLLSALVLFSCTCFGSMKKQQESLSSVQKLADGLYTMNYTYDYDIDELLKNGVSNHIELILKGIRKSFLKGNLPALGCTTFNAVTPEGNYIFARNFDYIECDHALVWTHPKNGYASVSSVSMLFNGYDKDFTAENKMNRSFMMLAPYVPFDGMNEKGLSIGILELECPAVFQLTEKPNLTCTMMIRAVLDKAATVQEAIEIFRAYDLREPLFMPNYSYHYHIADASGNSVVVEYINGKMNLIYPEKKDGNRVDYIAAANYCLTPGADDPNGMGQERVAKVYSYLYKTSGVLSTVQAIDVLHRVSMDEDDLHGFICSTIWSIVYDQTELTLKLCSQNNFEKVFEFSVDKPQVVK